LAVLTAFRGAGTAQPEVSTEAAFDESRGEARVKRVREVLSATPPKGSLGSWIFQDFRKMPRRSERQLARF
jgi:hypothetical protein